VSDIATIVFVCCSKTPNRGAVQLRNYYYANDARLHSLVVTRAHGQHENTGQTRNITSPFYTRCSRPATQP